MRKRVVFEADELNDLKTAVIRMLWAWQARKETNYPNADKHIERYQRLYVKITNARWDPANE